MNTIWSDHVQGIMTLYLTRKLRFDDLFFPQYQRLFKLDSGKDLRILEIGCGPGALAGALHRWYPLAEITGLDRDDNFIRFARENEPGISFLPGDATQLPFPDNSFDVTISNTVQEHMEPSAFWGEQLRVLKPGGICLCLSARRGITCIAPCLEQTEAERAFWSVAPRGEDELEKYSVCRYPMSEAELPASMEANGFTDVSTGYAVIDLTPDDPKYSQAFAEAMIEAGRQGALEAIRSLRSDRADAALAAVTAKYDQRLSLFRSGRKQWDTATSVTMILRGMKPYREN